MSRLGDAVYGAIFECWMDIQDRLGLAEQRRRVAAEATGIVLEIGVGTGRNLPHYERAERVVAIDPDAELLGRARAAADRAGVPVSLEAAVAEDLPFPDATFDTVVITLTLCTIPDPGAALEEARRVLRPGGRLVFLEHVRSPRPLIAGIQSALTPLWRRMSRGCHLDRDTLDVIVHHGFEVSDVWRSGHGRGILVQGRATPTGG